MVSRRALRFGLGELQAKGPARHVPRAMERLCGAWCFCRRAGALMPSEFFRVRLIAVNFDEGMLGLRLSLRLAVFALLMATLTMAQSVKPLSDFAEWIGAPALSPDGKTLAFEGDQNGISSGIFLRPFAGGENIYFAGRDSKEGLPTNPRWSRDGKQIAFLRFYCESCNHELFLKNYPRGSEHGLGEVCGNPPSWTPDGRFLVAAEPLESNEECRLALIPADGRRRIKMGEEGDLAAVSPDGTRLAFAAGNQLKLASLTADFRIAGAPVTLAKEPHAISSIHWVPDGHALLYQVLADGNHYSRLVSIEGASFPGRLVNPGGDIEISQILADGNGLGTQLGGESTLWRVDLRAAIQKPERVRSVPWTDHHLCVSPNGQMVAFATNRNGPTQIWVSRLDGSDPRVLVSAIPPFDTYGDRTGIDGISWSPNGKWIALVTEPGIGHGVDDARLFLAPADGGPLRVLVNLCSGAREAPPWSDDGRFVFIDKEDANYKSNYFQVDILTGKQAAVRADRLPVAAYKLAPLPSGAEQPHLAQDGRFLYFQRDERTENRIVAIHDFLPRLAASQ